MTQKEKRKVEEQTKFLPVRYSLQSRVVALANNIDKVGIQCAVPGCKGLRHYNSRRKLFSPLCSIQDKEHNVIRYQLRTEFNREVSLLKCGETHHFKLESTKEKIKATNLEKYQVENPLASQEIQSKIKITNLEKYGHENPMQSTETQEKVKASNMEKYGREWPLSDPTIREKGKETIIKKYGVDYQRQFQEKAEVTNLEKYQVKNVMQVKSIRKKNTESCYANNGVPVPLKSPDIMNKVKQTNLVKYGVPFVLESPEIMQKVKQTNLRKYQVENHKQKHYNLVNYNKLSKDFITETFLDENKYIKMDKFKEFIGCSETTVLQMCHKFGVEFVKKQGSSKAEEQLVKFIKNLDPETEVITNSRKLINPLELDIYLPEYNLAIEYNGMMFHSQGLSKYSMFNTPDMDKERHLKKTEACEERGIHLLHIFENEWLIPKKQEIWKSVIRNKMSKNNTRLFARKLLVRELSSRTHLREGTSLIEENHLQGGGAVGPIRFGLFSDGQLVSVMTFGRSRFHKESVFELIRFVTKRDTSIAGGASRLLKAFERVYKPNKLVSYANRRWSDGNLYHKLGFKLSHTSCVNYFYFKPSNILKLWSRNHFQKFKLKNYFENIDESMTEYQIMFDQGYRRIYDSGNYCFVKEWKE